MRISQMWEEGSRRSRATGSNLLEMTILPLQSSRPALSCRGHNRNLTHNELRLCLPRYGLSVRVREPPHQLTNLDTKKQNVENRFKSEPLINQDRADRQITQQIIYFPILPPSRIGKIIRYCRKKAPSYMVLRFRIQFV